MGADAARNKPGPAHQAREPNNPEDFRVRL
jgi:hypothetical protein